jgi:hypothetical protein
VCDRAARSSPHWPGAGGLRVTRWKRRSVDSPAGDCGQSVVRSGITAWRGQGAGGDAARRLPVDSTITLQISYLRGELHPTSDNPPYFDDKKSFTLAIDSATIAISPPPWVICSTTMSFRIRIAASPPEPERGAGAVKAERPVARHLVHRSRRSHRHTPRATSGFILPISRRPASRSVG